MNKFKIGDRVKTNSEMDVLKYGIISVKDYHIVEDSLYLTYGLKCHESVEFNERDLELVESSEEIAVKKFKEEFKEQVEHILEHEINRELPSSNDFKKCIEKILKLLECEDK